MTFRFRAAVCCTAARPSVLAGFLGAPPALAKAPMSNAQAPYFYRFKLGDAEATVVSDGPLPLGDPTQAFLGLSKEEIAAPARQQFPAAGKRGA